MKKLRWNLTFLILIFVMLFLAACEEPQEHVHEFGNWDTTKKATCAEEGLKVRYCSCGEEQTKNISKKDHYYVNGVCSRCGMIADEESNEESINRCAHRTTIVIDGMEPTCRENGLTDGEKCAICGVVLIEQTEIPKNNHVEETIPGKNATCKESGLTDGKKCKSCGKVLVEQQVIPVANLHDYEGDTCTVCGDVIKISDGLSYTLLEDDTYMVSGIGTCVDSDVVIPASYGGKTVTVIGANAFKDTNIASVYILAPITEIQYRAFSGCSDLRTIKIPETVTTIIEDAFEGCENLDSVYLDDFAKWCHVNFEFEDYPYGAATYVPVPNANPLQFTKRLYVDNVYTTHLVVPEGITTIVPEMFSGCAFFSAITIPSTVNYAEYESFTGCNKLKKVYITDLEKWFEIEFSPYSGGSSICESNPLFNDGELYLNGVLVEQLDIPRSVTRIPSKVFNGCSSIKRVQIHKDVEYIGGNAFQYCFNLESVTFEDGSCLKEIDWYAFYGCSNLSEFDIPDSVTTLHSDAISGSDDLYFELPENLTYVGSGALPYSMHETYDGCVYVGGWLISGYSGTNSTVTIKAGTIGIAEDAFDSYYSNTFTSVIIPASVKYMCYGAFSNHSALETVVFEEGSVLEVLPSSAFSSCTNLKSVVLPSTLKEIGYSAFFECSSLEAITLPKTVETIYRGAFDGCSTLTSILWGTQYNWKGILRYNEDVVAYFGKEELSDPEMLADYLTDLYFEYDWKMDA